MNICSVDNELIDHCPNCHGIWFDINEFSAFKAKLDIIEKVPQVSDTTEQEKASHEIYECMDCHNVLTPKKYSYSTDVYFHSCDQCYGFWLTNGNYNKLLKLTSFAKTLREDAKAITEEIKNKDLFNPYPKKKEKAKRVVPWIFIPFIWSIVLPLYDENETKKKPFITTTLITVNIFIFVIFNILQFMHTKNFFNAFGLLPSEFVAGISLHGLITYNFLHGGLFHLGFNLLFLWIFGDNIEDRINSFKFLLFYLFCGITAGLSQVVVNIDSAIPIVGASGAIAGVMGAYLRLFPKKNIKLLALGHLYDISAKVFLGFWIITQIVLGLVDLGSTTASVAWWAHVGGFIVGFASIPFFTDKPKVDVYAAKQAAY